MGHDSTDRLFPGKREVRRFGHLDRHPQSCLGSALADTHLEHPELAPLDRELDVAEVRIVALEVVSVAAQFRPDRRQALVEGGQRFGAMRARDDVLPLSVEQDVAVDGVLAGRGVAREQNPGRGIGAAVAEDHGLDGDRGTQVVRDPLAPSVRPGAIAVPGAEHGLDRRAQLNPRVLRDRVDADYVLEHLDEPLVAVACEGGITGGRGKSLDGGGREAEVEDGVHHPRHRNRGAGAHAHEKWIGRVAEAATDDGLDPAHVLADLIVEALRPAAGEVRVTGGRGDHETRRHWQAQLGRHHREVGRLAADDRFRLGERHVERLIDGVDVTHDPRCPFRFQH